MDQVAQVRGSTDIVSLIGEHITLKKAGRNFKALCPFHKEDSPSFVVSPERQIWHCFGCGKGGDCYTFLMEYERMEFPEALRVLAKRAGIAFMQSTYSHEISSNKDKMYALNKVASEFYHYVLTKHTAGKRALSYLGKRDIDDRLMRTFFIGFSPASGNALVSYLMRKRHYRADDLIEAGLAVRRGQRIIDFFTNRVMFPLTDHRGNVLGFSGRVLADGVIPKYINTRDTLVYRKGDVFFGFHISKDAVKKADEAILVEGEFDVIACFREGIGNVIGIKGTALTQSQVLLLSRFAKRVVLCFDDDTAGYEALCRSIPLLEKQQMVIHTAVMKGAKDPDEAMRNDRLGFKKAITHHGSVYDYLLERAVGIHGVATAEEKRTVADSLLPFFTTIQNEIVKEHYFRRISTILGTSYESVVREAEKLTKQEKIDVSAVTKKKRSREELLEEYLLALLLQEEVSGDAMFNAKTQLLAFIDSESATQKLLHHVLSHESMQIKMNKEQTGNIPKELVETFNICLLYPLPPFPTDSHREREVFLVVSALQKLYTRKKIQHLSQEVRQKEDQDTPDEPIEKTLSQLSSLIPKA